jgi:hypothetical protein
MESLANRRVVGSTIFHHLGIFGIPSKVFGLRIRNLQARKAKGPLMFTLLAFKNLRVS